MIFRSELIEQTCLMLDYRREHNLAVDVPSFMDRHLTVVDLTFIRGHGVSSHALTGARFLAPAVDVKKLQLYGVDQFDEEVLLTEESTEIIEDIAHCYVMISLSLTN